MASTKRKSPAKKKPSTPKMPGGRQMMHRMPDGHMMRDSDMDRMMQSPKRRKTATKGRKSK